MLFAGDKGQQALLAFSVLVIVQLNLVIGLLVLGIKGKEEIGTQKEVGVPYYVGAIIVAVVVSFIFFSSWQTETDTCTNSVEPDVTASKDLSHQDLHYTTTSL